MQRGQSMKINSFNRPQFVSANKRAHKNNLQGNFTRNEYKRKFDRTLLPTPANYYCKQFSNLKIKSESVKVRCCFHKPDNNPSLLISMIDGHFKCLACGTKGHDVIAFHMQRYHTTFLQAVTFFGAWSNE